MFKAFKAGLVGPKSGMWTEVAFIGTSVDVTWPSCGLLQELKYGAVP